MPGEPEADCANRGVYEHGLHTGPRHSDGCGGSQPRGDHRAGARHGAHRAERQPVHRVHRASY